MSTKKTSNFFKRYQFWFSLFTFLTKFFFFSSLLDIGQSSLKLFALIPGFWKLLLIPILALELALLALLMRAFLHHLLKISFYSNVYQMKN